MTKEEQDAIVEAVFLDLDKTEFEKLAREVAAQTHQNGEPLDEMKAGLKAMVIAKKAVI